MANKNITTKLTIEALAGLIKDNFAKKTELPTKLGDLSNDQNYQTQTQVDAAIAAKLSSTYKAAGTVSTPDFEKLTAGNVGNVYNVSTAFTTDATHYVEGLNKKYPAGTNIVIVNDSDTYKYDVLAGFVDLDGYVQKASDATDGNLAALGADGSIKDSGKSASDFVEAVEGSTLMTAAQASKLAGIADGATKVEASEINGNVKINGEEQQVYALPATVLTEADISDYNEDEIKTLLGIATE